MTTKAEYDAFLAVCPSRRLLDRISDKWVALILCALGPDGALRYSELNRVLVGVSQKMLTQTLRALERDGLLTRTVTPSVPVRVDYELTELGRSLVPVLEGLRHWSEANIERVMGARDQYDAAQAG
jgi:DNA-binding HxlR family transcriptional regulator